MSTPLIEGYENRIAGVLTCYDRIVIMPAPTIEKL